MSLTGGNLARVRGEKKVKKTWMAPSPVDFQGGAPELPLADRSFLWRVFAWLAPRAALDAPQKQKVGDPVTGIGTVSAG